MERGREGVIAGGKDKVRGYLPKGTPGAEGGGGEGRREGEIRGERMREIRGCMG